jgi:hypothetical protein
MLVACRLAGLSALETYYAGVRVGAQFATDERAHTKGSLFKEIAISRGSVPYAGTES